MTALRASNAELKKKLAEALEQQAATSEVLQRHLSSPGELEPVFQAMLANATRICEAKFGLLFLYEGDALSRRRAAWRPARHLSSIGGANPISSSAPEPALRTRRRDQAGRSHRRRAGGTGLHRA